MYDTACYLPKLILRRVCVDRPSLNAVAETSEGFPSIEAGLCSREATRESTRVSTKETWMFQEAARTVEAALHARPGGCVGFFLELDEDQDGFVCDQDMIDGLQAACHLQAQEASDFVRSLRRPPSNGGLIPVTSLWIAIKCAHRQNSSHDALSPYAQKDWPGGSASRSDQASASSRQSSHREHTHEASIRTMDREQFEVQVLKMSRAACATLHATLQRQHLLQHYIRLEACRMQELESQHTNVYHSALL